MTTEERIDELVAEIERLRARLDSVEAGKRAPTNLDKSARPFGRRAGVWASVAIALVVVPLVAWAVDLPHTFVNGQVADASQVNANFAVLEAALETHIADTTIHHPPITSVQGLSGGTITGNVTVTGIVTTTEVQGSPLRLTSPVTVEINAGTIARVNASGTIDLNGGTITLN